MLFRSGHSYVAQLISLFEENQAVMIMNCLEKHLTLSHRYQHLLKLHHYGIRSNVYDWLKVSQRMQKVIISE